MEGKRWQDKKLDWEGPGGPPPRKRKSRLRRWWERMFSWPYVIVTYLSLALSIAAVLVGFHYRDEAHDWLKAANRHTKTQFRLSSISRLVRHYALVNNRPPADLQAFLRKEMGDVQNLKPWQDFWGHDLIYVADKSWVELRSAGPDGEYFNDDDLLRRVSLE